MSARAFDAARVPDVVADLSHFHVLGAGASARTEDDRLQVASVMIEKFAVTGGEASSEFLDLNHTSKLMILVSLLIPKFARDTSIEVDANFGIGTLVEEHAP